MSQFRTHRALPWAFVLAAAIAGAALLLFSASPGSAQSGPPPANFRTLTLTGTEEVPPVTSDAAGTFTWRVTAAGMDSEIQVVGTDQLFTMGHFHIGAKGVNGPVAAFLFGPIAGGQGAVHSFKTVTAADLVGPLAGKTLLDLYAEIRKGNVYVNVHSVEFPAGVLRVQLPADAVPPAGTTPVATASPGSPAPTTAPKPPSTGSGMAADDYFGMYQLGLALLGVALGSAALIAVRRRS